MSDYKIVGDILVEYYGTEYIATVPQGVRSISPNAFSGSNVTYVSLPDSCETIRERAFQNCESLVSIIIPPRVRVIEPETFSGCRNLSSIVLPPFLMEIGCSAFMYCESLEVLNIPDSVKIIHANAFSDCTNLKILKLPKQLEEFVTPELCYCKSLKKISINRHNPNYEVRRGCLIDKRAKRLLFVTKKGRIPNNGTIKTMARQAFPAIKSDTKDIVIPRGVFRIEFCSFSNFKRLTRVLIPSSVKKIDYDSFSNCENLRVIYYEGSKKDWQRVDIDPERAFSLDNETAKVHRNIIYNYRKKHLPWF